MSSSTDAEAKTSGSLGGFDDFEPNALGPSVTAEQGHNRDAPQIGMQGHVKPHGLAGKSEDVTPTTPAFGTTDHPDAGAGESNDSYLRNVSEVHGISEGKGRRFANHLMSNRRPKRPWCLVSKNWLHS